MATAAQTQAAAALGEAGMVYAFAVKDGKAQAHRPLADGAQDADFVWIHVNFATEPGRQWLMRQSGLPVQLASMMLDRNEEPGAQVFGTGCLIVLEDRLRDFDADGGELAEIHVWLEQNRLITGRWKPLAATDRLRFRLEVGEAPPTAAALFFHLLEETVADLESFGRRVRRRFDALEDQVLEDAVDGVAGELGAIRREAIKLRRRAMPLRQLFARLQNTLPAWVKDEEGERFDPLLGRVERATGDLQECVEQSRLLHDEFAARSAERAGRNLYILSVLSAVMLPLNLVTGLFGMNVAGLPGLENHAAFWWILAGMVAFTVAVMVWFKRKRWF